MTFQGSFLHSALSLPDFFHKTFKQQRCNGDEMQWYLFYSKPNYMDEFCTVSFSIETDARWCNF